MKNLMKTAGKAMNLKFIWQNNVKQNIENNDGSYESAVENLHADTKERLEYLKGRHSLTERTEKVWKEKITKAASDAMEEIKDLIIDQNGNINSNLIEKNAVKIAKLTKTNKLGNRDINNMYRTEVVSRLNDYLIDVGVNSDVASQVLISSMKNMSYSDSTPTSKKVYDATNAMRYGTLTLNKGMGYKAFANEMDKGQDGVEFDVNGIFTLGGKKYKVKNFEVLIGAAMTKVDSNFLSKFIVENAIIKNGKLVATMQNGCKGNFVLADIQEVGDIPPCPCPNNPNKYFDGKVWVCPPGPTPIPDDDCLNCDVVQATTSADVTSEMDVENFLLNPDKCDNDIFELNFSKMEELNVFKKMGVLKKWTDNMTAREKWNTMSHDDQKWAIAQYQHEISSEAVERLEKFYGVAMILKDLFEQRVDGQLLEGGLWGAIKLLWKKDEISFAQKVNRKLKKAGYNFEVTASEIEEIIDEGEKQITEVRAQMDDSINLIQKEISKLSPEDQDAFWVEVEKSAKKQGTLSNVREAVEHGNLYQSKKYALSDAAIILSSMVVNFLTTGIPMPDIPLFHIKLPAAFFGTKIQQLPGFNAIASTSLGNEIGNSYSDFGQITSDHLDKEMQLGDNAAILGAELMHNIARLETELNKCRDAAERAIIIAQINKQNRRLQVWVQNMKNGMNQMQVSVQKREKDYKGEFKESRRHAFGFIENTEGRRKEVREDYKTIKKSLRAAKQGDEKDLTSSKTRESFKRIQQNLTTELNQDFGTDINFAGFGKEMILAKSYNLDIHRRAARNIKVQVNVVERNGQMVAEFDRNSVRFGKRSWDKMNRRQKNKVHEYIEEFQDRMAELKELHGLATVIDVYAKAINVRQNRVDIYSDSGQGALENVKESSSYGTLMRMERDEKTKEVLLGTYCDPNECWFTSDVREKLEEFFEIDESRYPKKKLRAFKELQKLGFEYQYNDMIQVVGKFITSVNKEINTNTGLGEYVITTADGKYCAPQDVQDVLDRGEIVYIYDNLTGRVHKRFPVTTGMIAGLGKKILPNIKKLGKDTKIISHGNHIYSSAMAEGMTQQQAAEVAHRATLNWIQTQSQYAGQGVVDYAVETTVDGTAVTGIKLILKGGVQRTIEFSVKQSLKGFGVAVLAGLLGQSVTKKHHRYNKRNTDVYTKKSREKSSIVVDANGNKKRKTIDSSGRITYKPVLDEKNNSNEPYVTPSKKTEENINNNSETNVKFINFVGPNGERYEVDPTKTGLLKYYMSLLEQGEIKMEK